MTFAAFPLALALALSARAAEPVGAADAGSDPWAIGESPVAPAGAPAANLAVDPGVSHWRGAVGTGIAYRNGGEPLASTHESHGVLLFFGGQADGRWSEGIGHTVRLRARVFTGGESSIYVPSEGDLEGAWSIGRRELRFVVARVEAARHPALAIQTLAQLSTLPSLEGALSLAGDRMRLDYFVSPVEVAWVWYFGGAHISHVPGWPTETDQPAAASAARARYALLVSPAVILSAEGDLVKLWGKADLFASAEGSVGWQILRRQAALHLTARWSAFRRRGEVPDTAATESELVLLTTATLSY